MKTHSDKPRAEVVMVTPEMARDWLMKNIKNRPKNMRRINKMADKLKEGQGALTNDAVAFDVEDRLWNGQHRLEAICLSGVPCECIVLRGSSTDAFMHADSGMKRTAGQALATLGYKQYNLLGSISLQAYRWVEGTFLDKAEYTSPADLVEFVKDNPILEDITRHAAALSGKNRIPWRGTSIGAAIFIAHMSEHMDNFVSFLDQVAKGAHLSPGSPHLALRNRMMTPFTDIGRNALIEQAALLIKAYQYHSAGKRRTVLLWRDGEEFPLLTSSKKDRKRDRRDT